jgi:cysteine desulfurase
MDHHSTTPLDRRVWDAMQPFFTEHFGNAASIQHRRGWIAKEAVDIARAKIAGALSAQPREIIFTGGATESNNLAIKGVAEQLKANGNHIITTQIEHASVLESCRRLERQGYSVTYLPVDAYGLIDIEELKQCITPATVLVSVMMANNEIGTLQSMEMIGNVCAERNVVFHTDATQALGKIPIDVNSMNIRLLSCSSHKIYGPKGIGALFRHVRNTRVPLSPQIDGAGQEHGMRSGTLNVPGIVGFGTAVQIAIDEMESEQLRISSLRDDLQRKLLSIGDISVNGHPTRRLSNTINITIHGVSADRLMTEMNDVAISAGSACLSENTGDDGYSHVLKAIGLDRQSARSTVRIGIGRNTTADEIDFAFRRFSETIQMIRTQTMVQTV